MSRPEFGTPEAEILARKAGDKMINIVLNVIGRTTKKLPPKVIAITDDKETSERFAAICTVKYIMDDQLAQVSWNTITTIRPGTTMSEVADTLIEDHKGVPLICDQEIADELRINSQTLQYDKNDHRRVVERPGGTLEVFTPSNLTGRENLLKSKGTILHTPPSILQ